MLLVDTMAGKSHAWEGAENGKEQRANKVRYILKAVNRRNNEAWTLTLGTLSSIFTWRSYFVPFIDDAITHSLLCLQNSRMHPPNAPSISDLRANVSFP